MSARSESPPVDEQARAQAAASAEAIRAAIANPLNAGARRSTHVRVSGPRRGLWLTHWANLPGLTLENARRSYRHALLPGWEYDVTEMQTEMIEDLRWLAATGERPTRATRTPRP